MNLSQLLLETDSSWVQYTSLIGRLFIGICFMIHGLGKLGIVGTGNMKGFEGWLASLNIPFPKIQARAAMLAELVGGALIVLGFFMRPACLLCIFVMIVAGVVGHKGGGYLITNNPPGAEYTINLAVICAILFVMGPGQYSIDALIFG